MNIEKISAVPESSNQLLPNAWMIKIEFIKHLIWVNHVVISIVGEQNSGKSSFANFLQSALADKINFCKISANPLFHTAAFFEELKRELNFQGELSSISDFIAACNTQVLGTLLIIDDAHYLPNHLIEDILKGLKEQGDSGRFHCCLISNYSLVPHLNQFAKSSYTDMIHSMELGCLTENETKTYVLQKMLAFPGAKQLITDELITQFYELTEGRLEKINHHMNDFFHCSPTPVLQNSKLLNRVGYVASACLVTIVLAYLGFSSEPAAVIPEQQLTSIPLQSQPILNERTIEYNEVALLSSIPTYTQAALVHVLQSTSLRRVNLVNEDETQLQNESMVLMDKVVVAPKVLSTQAKKHAAAPVLKIAQSARKSTVGYFTIQILASHNKNKLINFAKAHHISSKTQLHKTIHQGKAWYVLTLGTYPQRQQAKNAVHHLSKEIARFKPWVRTISELKTVV